MDQQQQELRRAAAEAFIEALDQLPQTIQSELQKPKKAAPVAPSPQSPIDAFEEAVADIERFMQQKEELQADLNAAIELPIEPPAEP